MDDKDTVYSNRMHFLVLTDGTVHTNDHLCTLGQRRKTNVIIHPL